MFMSLPKYLEISRIIVMFSSFGLIVWSMLSPSKFTLAFSYFFPMLQHLQFNLSDDRIMASVMEPPMSGSSMLCIVVGHLIMKTHFWNWVGFRFRWFLQKSLVHLKRQFLNSSSVCSLYFSFSD